MATVSEQTETLRKWNLWAAGLHAAQALVLLFLATGKTWAVNLGYQTSDSLQSQVVGHTVLAPAAHHWFELRLSYLLALILLLAALAHFLMAVWYRPRYEADLKNGLNRLRWIEYALTGGLMLAAIALLGGISDFGTLVLLFGLTALAGLLALSTELQNPWRRAMQVKWLPFWLTCAAGLLPWLVIAFGLVATDIYGNRDIPTYLHVLYDTILLGFVVAAGNLWLQYRRRGRWGEYPHSERMFIVISLVVKAALVWQIYAAVLT
jgi:hypothetical protein